MKQWVIGFVILLTGIGLLSFNFLALDHNNEIHKGKCYDYYHNEIIGSICNVKDEDFSHIFLLLGGMLGSLGLAWFIYGFVTGDKI